MRVAQAVAQRAHGFLGLLARQSVAQAGLFPGAQPVDLLETVGQALEHQQAEQHHRHALEEEHPLPAAQATRALQAVEDPARQRTAEHAGHRHGDGEQRGHLPAVAGRIPAVDVDQDAGEEAGLGGTEQESQDVEAGRPLHQQQAGRQGAPDHHDGGDPAARPEAFQHQVAGHAAEHVGDEEHPGAETVDGLAEAEIGAHLQLGEADVDPIEMGEEVADQQQGHQLPADALVSVPADGQTGSGGGGGSYGHGHVFVRRKAKGVAGLSPPGP
ncbi:hypothetical protein D3C78_994030 [compost metagenome]